MNATVSSRRVAANTGTLVAGALLGQGAKGLIAVAIGRELGPGPLGAFTFVWTIAALAAHYTPLGINTLLVRELSRARARVAVRDAFRLAVTLNLGVTILLLGGSLLVGARGDLVAAMAVAAPYVLLTPAVLVLGAQFHARERMGLEAAAQIAEGAVALLGALGALWAGWGLTGALAALSAGRAVNVALSWLLHRQLPALPSQVPGQHTAWSRILRLSLPMGGASVFTAIVSRADIVVLGLLVAATQVGIYSAAAIVVALLADVTTELNRAVYPALSRMVGRREALTATVAGIWRLELVVTTAAAAGLATLAGPIVELLYGPGFDEAARVLAVLAWVLPMRTLSHLSGTALYAVDRAGHRTRATGLAAAVNLAANVALIPWLGLWGAVVSTLVTDLLLLTVSASFAADVRPRLSFGVGTAVLTAGFVAGVAALTPGPVLVRVAAGAAAFLVVSAASPTGRDAIRRVRATEPT